MAVFVQVSQSLYYKKKNWDTFREILLDQTNYNKALKIRQQVERNVEELKLEGNTLQ